MTPAPSHDCIVIGSGASGVACASALLEAGRSVLMLDAGVTLEPARAEALEAARRAGPLSAANAPWLAEETALEKIPRKRIYGSEFPFQHAAKRLRLEAEHVGAEPSFAMAGFSTIWGASVLPFAASDTPDWPVTEAELAPHYAACAKLLGVAGQIDDIADWLPFHAPPAGQLRASRQAGAMLETLTRHRAALHAAGLRFGRARLAVKTPASGGCIYCGLCLHGCPDRLIYSANDTLAALRGHPRFAYRPGVVVETVSENAAAARAHASDLHTRAPLAFDADRVFVAAGALSTSGMLLRSAALYDTPVAIKDAQYFLLPLIQFAGAGKTREEKLHTMAQLFLELRDPAISPYIVHLQVYTYNSLLARTVRQKLGPLLEPLARWGDAHFILIQGYLHSAHSGAIEMTLKRDGASDRLEARGVVNPETRPKVRAVVDKLAALALRMGALPLAPLMEISEPGRGFHHGGAFPMRAHPGRCETDTLGRPFGWRRIHAVDATVLPSIPATTITFPVMANAHRIAAIAAQAR